MIVWMRRQLAWWLIVSVSVAPVTASRAESVPPTTAEEQLSLAQLLEEVRRVFKPEFLNRVDDTIVFRPLTLEDLHKIVEIEVAEVRTRLQEQGIAIELSAEAKEFLIQKGFDPTYGARPLKRTIARYLEDSLAQEIIAGHFREGAMILVEVEQDRLTFHQASTTAPTSRGQAPSSKGA